MAEYASFILLLGSLFVISGGIVISGDIEGTPLTNALFLGVGAVLGPDGGPEKHNPGRKDTGG